MRDIVAAEQTTVEVESEERRVPDDAVQCKQIESLQKNTMYPTPVRSGPRGANGVEYFQAPEACRAGKLNALSTVTIHEALS